MKRRAKKPRKRQVQKLHSVEPTEGPALAGPSRTTKWRHRRALAIVQRGCDCASAGLPILHANTDTKVRVEEKAHYREHRQRHLALHPNYDAGWPRPSAETAKAIYDLLRDHLPPLADIHPDPITAQQLIVVTLDVAVTAGRYGYRVDDHRDDPRNIYEWFVARSHGTRSRMP